MINYKTNGNWLRDIANLSRSWTMQRIVKSTILVGLYSLLVCVVLQETGWADRVPLNISVFSLLGVLLSIVMVFRTNTAYGRWWEARMQWGALVNNTRNLAIYVDAMWPAADAASRVYIARSISNFCFALVEHLRDGTKLDELDLLPQEKEFLGGVGHPPNHISRGIFKRIAQAHRDGVISEGDYINIQGPHQSLLDILGACERIKKTPIPFSYAIYLKIFVLGYGVLMPFALVDVFALFTVPIVMFVFFALLGLELMGEEIEDPFGLDCNDLPTGDIALTISENVYEILAGQSCQASVHGSAPYEKVF